MAGAGLPTPLAARAGVGAMSFGMCSLRPVQLFMAGSLPRDGARVNPGGMGAGSAPAPADHRIGEMMVGLRIIVVWVLSGASLPVARLNSAQPGLAAMAAQRRSRSPSEA